MSTTKLDYGTLRLINRAIVTPLAHKPLKFDVLPENSTLCRPLIIVIIRVTKNLQTQASSRINGVRGEHVTHLTTQGDVLRVWQCKSVYWWCCTKKYIYNQNTMKDITSVDGFYFLHIRKRQADMIWDSPRSHSFKPSRP